MKPKKITRSVTTELFFTYFLGYIAITVIIAISLIGSIIAYEFLCNPSIYNS